MLDQDEKVQHQLILHLKRPRPFTYLGAYQLQSVDSSCNHVKQEVSTHFTFALKEASNNNMDSEQGARGLEAYVKYTFFSRRHFR